MIKRVVLFLVVNFSALALGGIFTKEGVASVWYQNLHQAPWTPPSWVFGAMWTLIMVCFSVYMAYLISKAKDKKKIIFLFGVQWVLNVAWNPTFFYFHAVALGFLLISFLTLLVGYFLIYFKKELRLVSLFILPYFIWLCIASSLNAYILFYN